MAIENEIVRFIAEMELDPQDQAKFTEGLKDSEKRCEALRDSIEATNKKLTELRLKGKENTNEFKNLMALCKPCHSRITAQMDDRWHKKPRRYHY